MKLFTGGIATETNTFAPFPTGLDDFEVVRLTDHNDAESDAQLMTGALHFLQGLVNEREWELVPSLLASAEPGGTTTRAAYETLREEFLSDLKAALPVDGILLFLHGAMVADGYDDAEGDLIERVREIVGPDVPIAVELDLHCHLTHKIVDLADIVVTYKEYPHTDTLARARDTFTLLADRLEGKIKPTMALYDCSMIGVYRTSHPPVREIVDALFAMEGEAGVLSASWAHGFPWGDMSEMGARVLIVTDNDIQKAQQLAEQLGQRIYAARTELEVPTHNVSEAIQMASERYTGAGPVVIADVTDNAGGGAPSDSTFALREMLAQQVSHAGIAMMWDPIVVQVAMRAGPGATLDVRLGGKMGPASGDPLDLTVEVIGIVKDMVQMFPQGDEGAIPSACGDSVALRCAGIDIIVNSLRGQVFGLQVFSNFGLDPTQYKLIVVKSMQHFYAAYAPIAQEVLYMNAPGALTPDYPSLPYRKADLKKYPWISG